MIHWDWIKTYFVASAIELACILVLCAIICGVCLWVGKR
jgi:hypothetical protein